jgi:hypothetical protein
MEWRPSHGLPNVTDDGSNGAAMIFKNYINGYRFVLLFMCGIFFTASLPCVPSVLACVSLAVVWRVFVGGMCVFAYFFVAVWHFSWRGMGGMPEPFFSVCLSFFCFVSFVFIFCFPFIFVSPLILTYLPLLPTAHVTARSHPE